MEQIYKNAKQTLVWVGPPSTHEIAEHVRDIILDDALIKKAGKDGDSSAFFKREYLSSKSSAYSEIGGLLANPWFSRKWIIQELAVSRDVVVLYNGVKLSWDSISMLSSSISSEVLRTAIMASFYNAVLKKRVKITGQDLDT